MEENKTEFLEELMKLTRKQYTQLLEIQKLTKELGDALSSGDSESVQLILNLRQREMEQAAETKRDLRTIAAAPEMALRVYFAGLLDGSQRPSPDSFEEQKISEFSRQCRECLAETIALDKMLSKRVGGKDSYYENK